MGNQGHASDRRRTVKEFLDTGVIGPVREVHVWAGHWVEWVNYAKGLGPVPGSNFQYSGWTTKANHLDNVAYRTGKKIEWDYRNMRATNAPEADPFINRPESRKGWDDILKC